MQQFFIANRESYFANPNASEYLVSASKRIYNFIKNELKISMYPNLFKYSTIERSEGSNRRTLLDTGSDISFIYQALKDERLLVSIMECMKEAVKQHEKQKVISGKL